MGGGGEAGEDALLGKEERAGADGEKGALVGGVLLLQLGEGSDEGERLGVSLDDLVAVAADDDENVKVAEALVGLLEGDLGANGDARVGDDLGLSSGDGNLEGLGVCGVGRLVSWAASAFTLVSLGWGERENSVDLETHSCPSCRGEHWRGPPMGRPCREGQSWVAGRTRPQWARPPLQSSWMPSCRLFVWIGFEGERAMVKLELASGLI